MHRAHWRELLTIVLPHPVQVRSVLLHAWQVRLSPRKPLPQAAQVRVAIRQRRHLPIVPLNVSPQLVQVRSLLLHVWQRKCSPLNAPLHSAQLRSMELHEGQRRRSPRLLNVLPQLVQVRAAARHSLHCGPAPLNSLPHSVQVRFFWHRLHERSRPRNVLPQLIQTRSVRRHRQHRQVAPLNSSLQSTHVLVMPGTVVPGSDISGLTRHPAPATARRSQWRPVLTWRRRLGQCSASSRDREVHGGPGQVTQRYGRKPGLRMRANSGERLCRRQPGRRPASSGGPGRPGRLRG